jgi:glycine cleavage system H protein
MSRFPADLHYAESHEWVRPEGDVLTVGITWFAQDSLGDVVHVELPRLGAHVTRGQSVAEIESVKAVSEIYAPVAGEIVEVNSELDGNEEVVNKDPYGGGWLFKVRAGHAALAGLMNASAYEKHVAEQDH